ncbi:MAG TPA: MBL fold metallo-hydrolase [Methylomirabilota bacterium]|nr:MBL fold metallo-hydrolase [Methylomirabilota bacterium]
MRSLFRRRDLLKVGALTTVGGILVSRGAPPPAQAVERASAPLGAGASALSTNHTLEALKDAVRWPQPAIPVILALTGQYLAAGHDEEAHGYFRERAAAELHQPIFGALEGMFQARRAGEVSLLRRVAWIKDAIAKLDRAAETGHPVARYLRGVTLAELPARFGRAESAVTELEWVLEQRDTLPPGLRRSVHRGLARALTTLERRDEAQAALARSGYPSLDPALPQFTTDFSVTARDGFRFRPPRLLEVAPRVHVAQGHDFADLAFVLTDAGIVAVDAGTTEASARGALGTVRRLTSLPVTHVILTHAHWDHVGGLAALTAPGTRVIAQARFAEELQIVNETGVPFRYFFGGEAGRRYDVVPDQLVEARQTLTVGGTEFTLHPVRGGETVDALLIHLPATGVLFVGDVFMPYLGAPFLPEGSAEGLFETIALIRSLDPRTLVHGHPPLTELFTVEALPGLETALREVHGWTLEGIGDGRTVAEMLQQNWLPASLRTQPQAVMPFLVIRDHFIQRVAHQRTGYWKPDGDGIDVLSPREWAGALNLLAGGQEAAFVRSGRALLEQGDETLALKLADLGLLTHPASRTLTDLRRHALDRLRVRHQGLDPFKFIVYSEWAGADLPPVH